MAIIGSASEVIMYSLFDVLFAIGCLLGIISIASWYLVVHLGVKSENRVFYTMTIIEVLVVLLIFLL